MSGDLRCLDDLDLYGRETETDLEDLEQDVIHRLGEMPGSNLDDPDRGLGLSNMLSGIISSSIEALAVSELRKDDRIDSSTAKLSDDGGTTFTLDINIEVGAETLGISVRSDANGFRSGQ